MFKLNRSLIGLTLFTITMLIFTTWLISHSIVGEYLRLGKYYFSQYLSRENTQEAEAGEILMYMGFVTAMILIALFSIWLSKTVKEERALMLILIIIAFISAIAIFYDENYGFDGVMYISDTPWIWTAAVGSAAAILSEAYFLLVRPLRKEIRKKA